MRRILDRARTNAGPPAPPSPTFVHEASGDVLPKVSTLSAALSQFSKTKTVPVPDVEGHQVNGQESSSPRLGVRDSVKKLYEGPELGRGYGTNWVEEYPDDLRVAPELTDESLSHALVLRYCKRRSTHGQPLCLHSFIVQSPYIRKALVDVFKFYPGYEVDVDRLIVENPFRPFYYRWTELSHRAANDPDVAIRRHLQLLVEALLPEFEETLQKQRDLAANGTIDFDDLWTLYEPGSAVFAKFGGLEHCFVLEHCQLEEVRKSFHWELKLWCIDYDGMAFGWRSLTMTVDDFYGVRKISGLPVVPRAWKSGQHDLVDSFVRRGELLNRLIQEVSSYKAYDGIVELQVGRRMMLGREKWISGRIMVDPERYAKHMRDEMILVSQYPDGFHKLAENSERSLAEDNVDRRDIDDNSTNVRSHPSSSTMERHRWTRRHLDLDPEALCIGFVRGYCMTSKAWAEFHVTNVEDVKWNTHAFDKLVMSAPRKMLLKALVEEHKEHKTKFDDIVAGKGQGLILLLVGQPGTGKTLTAESIADKLQLPLYVLNATQLGDHISEIEEKLTDVLELTAAWDAVVLLDEADAFLEKRDDDDIFRKRNKRVAAFLRVLEYYKGILILTTNRQIDFDEAFFSRIHLTLKFPDLDFDSRAVVWKNFLESDDDVSIPDHEINELAKHEMNGRQIKNVVKMARLLAKNEVRQGLEGSLCTRHIRNVLTVMEDHATDLEVTKEPEPSSDADSARRRTMAAARRETSSHGPQLCLVKP